MTTPATTRLSVSDAALRLGVSYWIARDMLLRGQIRGGKDGRGRYYINPEHLEQVAEERERAAETAPAAGA